MAKSSRRSIGGNHQMADEPYPTCKKVQTGREEAKSKVCSLATLYGNGMVQQFSNASLTDLYVMDSQEEG